MKTPNPVSNLVSIMAALRHPDTGCPWDLAQDFASIAPYTIEEAYEVDDAIRAGDRDALKSELGDLLLQVVFHSQMAAERGYFTFDDVAADISEKMIRRHPHVFGDAEIATAADQTAAWEDQKAEERRGKASAEDRQPSALDGVATALPALMRADKLQKRAARIGFDWPDAQGVVDKIAEEAQEVAEAHESGHSVEHIEEEVGDLLFSVSNLARFFKLDAEVTLRKANHKFEARFRRMEDIIRSRSLPLPGASLAQMEAAWLQAKAEEKAGAEATAEAAVDATERHSNDQPLPTNRPKL